MSIPRRQLLPPTQPTARLCPQRISDFADTTGSTSATLQISSMPAPATFPLLGGLLRHGHWSRWRGTSTASRATVPNRQKWWATAASDQVHAATAHPYNVAGVPVHLGPSSCATFPGGRLLAMAGERLDRPSHSSPLTRRPARRGSTKQGLCLVVMSVVPGNVPRPSTPA